MYFYSMCCLKYDLNMLSALRANVTFIKSMLNIFLKGIISLL